MNIHNRYHILAKASPAEQTQQLLLERCRRDTGFWFDNFCWTFDPRKAQPHLPFRLFPFQRQYLESLCHAIEAGEDLLVEKSRDMGITWITLLAFQYYWLFSPGSNFHLGSRKMEFVDRKGDISTLFEKLRYNLMWLPPWMRPHGFNPRLNDNQFKLINPENGNIITGESANPNFARGGRYKGILFDEFPFWPSDAESYTAAGQSSPCRILVGTPCGKNNRFAELRFHSPIRVDTVHWQDHPEKDPEWYKRQKARMTEDEIARELDINYHLSVKDRVFREFGEQHKRVLVPVPGRRVIRSWDFGYHCPACLFLQVDDRDRLLVLHEVVGHQTQLVDFARRVLAEGKERFAETAEAGMFEDYCDPAGSQKSDKTTRTSIEILNSLGVHPFYDRSLIRDGIELIRHKLSVQPDGEPGLLVDRSCGKLIEALEGGYRYPGNGSDMPVQEHPYEDVMDCLRYAVVHKCSIPSPKRRRKTRYHRPGNRYTGY